MPRVLLLLPTSTYRTQAFMDAAGRLGVDVTVASEQASTMAKFNPAGLLTLDFDHPEHAARQAVEFAGQHPLNAVVPVDDQVTQLAAVICRKLSLRHNSVESVTATRNKHLMRQRMHEAGVPSPRFQLCAIDYDPARLARRVAYPCVVKPLSLSGSRGVIRANDETQFVHAVKRLAAILQDEYRRPAGSTKSWNQTIADSTLGARDNSAPTDSPVARQFLVEDYLAGQEVALEGLLSRGRLQALALFDKPDPMDGPFFEETIFVTPSRLSDDAREQIVWCAQRAANALGLTEGPIHAELRINDDGPWILELNPRSIGGLCSHVLRFGTGLSLEELIIRHALGDNFVPPGREPQPAGVMMIPIPRAGRLIEVQGIDDAQNVAGIDRVAVLAHPGQQLVPLPEGSRYLGFLFARAESIDAVETALRRAHQQLHFAIDGVNQAGNTF